MPRPGRVKAASAEGVRAVLDRFLPVASAPGSEAGVYRVGGVAWGPGSGPVQVIPGGRRGRNHPPPRDPGRPAQMARRPAKARATVSSSAYWTFEPAGRPCARRETVTPVAARRSAR